MTFFQVIKEEKKSTNVYESSAMCKHVHLHASPADVSVLTHLYTHTHTHMRTHTAAFTIGKMTVARITAKQASVRSRARPSSQRDWSLRQ